MAVVDLAFTPTFASLYGAQLLASVLNAFLYGAALLMVLQYFRAMGKTDHWSLKLTVIALICTATMETAASLQQSYDCFITKFGRQELFNEIIPAVAIEFICVYITAFIAQVFFATRIWKVGSHFGLRFQWVTIPVVSLALIQLGSGAAQVKMMVEAGLYTTLDQKTPQLVMLTTLQGASAASCDILITVVLCWAFHTHRSGIRRTNSLIDKLIIYSINRGAVTSICALLAILLYKYASGTFFFLIPFQATTQFYVISAVSVLTSRESLREEMDHSFHISDLVGGTTQDEVGSSALRSSTSNSHNRVQVSDGKGQSNEKIEAV